MEREKEREQRKMLESWGTQARKEEAEVAVQGVCLRMKDTQCRNYGHGGS